MRGGKRIGAGRPASAESNVKMFFLRVPVKLFELLHILTPDEKRQALEFAAMKKKLSTKK